MQAKVSALRSRKVEVPILFVPPHIKKSQIYLPGNGEILVDDSIKNIVDWEQKGGNGIYFSEELEAPTKVRKIKSLKEII